MRSTLLICATGLLAWGGMAFWGACKGDPYRNGALIYKTHCANCHMDGGEGLGKLIPPLAGADYLATHRDLLPCIVRYGLSDTIVVNGIAYTERMAGIEQLSEIQIANVLNYIQNSWGNKGEPFTLDEVRGLLRSCEVMGE
ncbi:MAG: c-type cytochrome [Saprospiraceae bacterium]